MGLHLDQISDVKLRRRIEEADAIQNRDRRMGRLQTTKPESNQRRSSQNHELEKCTHSVALRIGFVVFTRKFMDGDNLQTACKAIRDVVCESLGLRNDADSDRLSFEYGQVKTCGRCGILVLIAVGTGGTSRLPPQWTSRRCGLA